MSKVLIWSLFIIIIVIASIILFNLPYWLLLIIAVIPIIEDLNRKKKMNKSCYTCHVVKNISEMEEIGVWVCKDCLKKSENKSKKKKNK